MKRDTMMKAMLAFGLGVPLFALQEPAAQDPVQEPAPHELPADKDCIDCHGELAEGAMVHEPVEEEMCDACHEQDDEDLHVFLMPENQTDTCLVCHDEVGGTVMHDPVAKGHCTTCHDPHHSEAEALLREEDQSMLCADCHDDYPGLEEDFMHGPVDAGLCTICHLPHASEEPKLLLEEKVSLCLSCHEDMEEEMDEAENLHIPVEEDCSLCHDPHSGPNEYQLIEPGRQLCFSCHEGVRDSSDLKVDHSVVKDDRACMNCHQPHHSAFPAMLNESPAEVCMGCHDKAIKVDEERTIASMAGVMQLEFTHGPIQEGDCSACHDPHGADVFSILRESYPRKFYSKWKPDLYSLCFRCHESTIFTDEKTETLTGFRDGDVNLHYMHVNKAKKGRTCRACHEVHASSQPLHLAEEVPFGSWSMPINFEKTPDGGSCSPGCHDPEAYSRNRTEE